MAIVDMSRISFVGLLKDQDEIMNEIMNLGVIEISRQLSRSEGFSNDELQTLREQLNIVSDTIARLSEFDDRKKPLFSIRRNIEIRDFRNIVSRKDHLIDICNKIGQLDLEIAHLKSETNRLESINSTLAYWWSYNVPLEIVETAETKIVAGSVPNAADYNELTSEIEDKVLYAELFTVSTSQNHKNICVVCHKTVYNELMDVLKKYDFLRVTFPGLSDTVENNISLNKDKIKSNQDRIKKISEEIIEYSRVLPELEVLYDHFVMEIEAREANKNIISTSSTFMFEGWVPKKEADKVVKTLANRRMCWVAVREPYEDENPPILLDNGPFIQPIESIVAMFSMPDYREADPSFAVGPFFILFFGLMLGDAGYGLLMALFCGLLLKIYKPDKQQSGFIKLMFFCGLSTMLWGALFGSWFGNFLYVISNKSLSIPPIWFDPVADPERMLVYSLGIGVFHLFFGFGMKGYNLIRKGKYLDALYDSVFWIIYFSGETILLLPFVPTMDPEKLAPLMPVGTVLLITGFILVFLTKGRHSKNIAGRIVSGLSSLYDMVSFLSDVLSYSRLLALGLATGVIASVINDIAIMGGYNFTGLIMFFIIFALVHVFNLLINAMGAYVHSIRLQYVEFFGKFYEGGGESFVPLARNTKYIKLVETKNIAAASIAA